MQYARLGTIQANIERSQAYMVELKRQKRQTESKGKELFIRGKIDEERRVLAGLEKAYSDCKRLIKSKRV